MLTTALLAFALFQPPVCQVDAIHTAVKDLHAKDVEKRLNAIPVLVADGGMKSGKALEKALKDSDWGVQIAAADALAGWLSLEPTPSLVALALSTRVTQVRLAAARALAQRDAQLVTATLASALGSGDEALAACFTLAQLPAGEYDDLLFKGIDRLFHKAKSPQARAAAASTLHLLSQAARLDFLQRALADEDLQVAVAAVEGVIHTPFLPALESLQNFLWKPEVGDILGRRLCRAVAAILIAEGNAESPTATVFAADFFAQRPLQDVVAWRIAVIARLLLEAPGSEPSRVQSEARENFLKLAQDRDASVAARATAVWALGGDKLGGEATTAVLRAAMALDESPRVRRAAMVAWLELMPMDTELGAVLLERIHTDADPSVRRLAVVSLGVPELVGVAAGLAALCEDSDWQVAICAAVSLGKTRDTTALKALAEVCQSRDWRKRGAAVVGLSHLYQKAAIGVAIEMLADPEPVVARTAHEFLQTVTYQKLPREVEAYQEWWAKNEAGMLLLTPEKARERGRAYADFGGKTINAPYKEMDVFVFQSHGDHIQDLMARRDIQYTLTASGLISMAEVHPFGVYIANCVGNCTSQDIDYLQWSVLTGGYLFSSCWALNGTIEHMEPGVMQALRRYLSGNLLDQVKAEMTVAASPYLQGVFDAGSQPIYSLEGAHLIEVLLPERCEVLMDSPECASRWEAGNLAAWFAMGHGLMLDSANHFGSQGFTGAGDFKKPIDRQAYAVNHMGLTLEDLRKVQTESWWKSNRKAEEFIWDESAFRFLTNFVRWKRAGKL